MINKWERRNKNFSKDDVIKFAQDMNVSNILAEVLLSRNLETKTKVKNFFKSNKEEFLNYELTEPIQNAVERIIEAIENGENIVIYGDYDCDGTLGSFILYDYLSKIGSSVSVYIPNRLEEGYGLNKNAIELIAENNTDLVITVDNGIASIDEAEYILDLGMDLIITDHHEPGEILPESLSIIDFKLEENSPFIDVCGATVSLLLVIALNRKINDSTIDLDTYFQLASIATIADIVNLSDSNRNLVKYGLKTINENDFANSGMKLLKELLELNTLNSGLVGFRLAPIVNAAGRLGDAKKIIALLASEDIGEQSEIANFLIEENTKRSNIEQTILKDALEIIKNNHLNNDDVIVVSGENWHSGVIGIVASRIQELYYKPVIVISVEDGIGHASCRSIKGFNIFKALENSKDFLVKFGGHEQAAGFTINKENIDSFREDINSKSTSQDLKSSLNKTFYYDTYCNASKLDIEFIELIQKFQPFGVGNPEPIFRLKVDNISNFRLIGKKKEHLSFKADNIDCIYFNNNQVDLLEEGPAELLVKTKINTFKEPSIQLNIIDIKQNPLKFFNSAQKILNSSNNSEVLKQLINKIDFNQVIDRKFLTSIYKLAKKANSKGFYLTNFLNKSNFSALTLAIGLNILKEANLLNFHYNNNIIKFEIIPQKNKVSLEDTQTFKLIKDIIRN